MPKKIVARLSAAAKALVTPEPLIFRSAGKVVKCHHCSGLRFVKRSVSMNTGDSELLGVAFLDPEACVLVCAKCSRLEWFARALDGADA